MSVEWIDKDCGCKGCSLWLRLEGERNDTSYKATFAEPQPVVIKTEPRVVTERVEVKVADPKRDQLFYHAGRYSAGVRDQNVLKAWAVLNKEKTK